MLQTIREISGVLFIVSVILLVGVKLGKFEQKKQIIRELQQECTTLEDSSIKTVYIGEVKLSYYRKLYNKNSCVIELE